MYPCTYVCLVSLCMDVYATQGGPIDTGDLTCVT